VKDTQHTLHEMVANFVASNTHAEIALAGLIIAAAVFGLVVGRCGSAQSAATTKLKRPVPKGTS
jgi:hypothetical protein